MIAPLAFALRISTPPWSFDIVFRQRRGIEADWPWWTLDDEAHMHLSTPVKIVFAVLTVLPLIYMALFLVSFFLSMTSDPGDSFVFDHFPLFMAIHLGVMLLMFALLIFYVVFLFKTDAVRNDMKALWAVVLFFGGPIAMPVFWYLYVWRNPQPPPSPAVV